MNKNIFLFMPVLTMNLLMSSFSSPAAQITIHDLTIDNYSACINDAINSNLVTKNKESIKFSCRSNVAENFFNFMRHKDIEAISKKWPSGTYLERTTQEMYGTRCWHKIAQADGQSTSLYGCDIYFEVGPFLNK